MKVTEKSFELISYLKHVEATQSPTALACSFGAEDMVLLDAVAKHARKIGVFTLDTGRLPEETQNLLEAAARQTAVCRKTMCSSMKSFPGRTADILSEPV